ncbi:MAG: DUF4097 family beta strand repeat-containing protein, partial [Acidobacteria bacterium]|nr:DUF4097 family beta strand repeat-containing protein [Acidobacteriota bacterium]
MDERCNNCGAELFAGQQFCRQCGAPTRQFSTGEMPTQILPGAQPQQQPTAQQHPRAGTTQLGGRDTDSFYRSQVAQQYQPPQYGGMVAPAQTGQLEPKRKRGGRGWIVALLVVFGLLVVCSLFAATFVAGLASRRAATARKVSVSPPGINIPVPPIPPVPPMPDMSEAGNLSPLDESGAEVSDDETVINKTFALKPDATFTLQQIRGDVTITGWDEPQAQVTITKEGGDEGDRAGAQIMYAATDRALTLRTPEELEDIKDVKYEIKLPRSLKRIEINALDADVTLSNFAGGVSVKAMKGDFSATQLTGAVELHTMKGDISVNLKGATPAQGQSYNTVKGDITLSVGGANAELQAETVAGSISADGGWGVSVEKQIAGSRAGGTVGRGGKPVEAKTVNGSIR